MQIPPNALVTLTLDPADYVFALNRDERVGDANGGFSGSVSTRADGRVVLRCSAASAAVSQSGSESGSAPESEPSSGPPFGDLSFAVEDPQLPLPDALFLLSVLLLTEHHQDAFLHRTHPWRFVDATTERVFRLPHPPRIETAQALLGSVSVTTRVRLLVEACQLALPIWTEWARGGDLTYFDGMGLSAVRHDLAEATVAAVSCWLDDRDAAPLSALMGQYHGLHWPMLEDEWSCPQNVYYSLFAPCNAADCARADGDLEAALVCIRQAAAARATNGADEFLGEPFRKAFFLAWWRACLHVLCVGEGVVA